jgi:6,7-dimethyl-8-ribityllumazine synthase
VAARFHETVVERLLEGALATLESRGAARADVRVIRVAGAFELPQAALAAVRAARSAGAPLTGLVALGAIVRGETPHFDFVCAETSRGLMHVALDSGVPLGFGLLTCDDLGQALARAGGDRGNKGAEAAIAALDLADAIARLHAEA